MSIKTDNYCVKHIEEILSKPANIKYLESQKPSIYDYSYEPILKHFRSICQQDAEKWLICGAHQAYTWMPNRVTLKLPKTIKNSELSSLHEIINQKGKYFSQDDNDIKRQLKSLRSFISDSIVGTSKFLHFSFPEVFPIWDSRVANTLGSGINILHNKDNGNDIKHYIAYARAIHEICKNNKQLVKSLDHIELLKGKTCVRKIEYALFLIGGKD